MHHFWRGKTHSQAHKNIPKDCYEEEQGRDGFYGPVSHLVRKSHSTRWTDIKGPLKPRMYNLNHIKEQSSSHQEQEQEQGQRQEQRQGQRLVYNSHLQVFYLTKPKSDNLNKIKGFRNADGDLIYFCHKGQGEVFTEYGLLSFKEGSYIVIPKCLVHSFVLQKESVFFVIESLCGYFTEPKRGMLGRHAVYDIQSLQKPDLDFQQQRKKELGLNIKEIEIKKSSTLTTFTYDKDIYDVLGWKGDLFPFVLDIKNIMPVMSHRAHLPPSVHTTFLTSEFVVCSFVPRPLESDPDSLKVPFFHQNIDYDEILFYHAGDFFSRDNLETGMMSFHPSGFPHGPHPKAFQSAKNKTKTDEYAVMIDSKKSLSVEKSLSSVEWKDYWKSWK